MDEFVEWVRDRDYYHDQIQYQRDVPARSPVTRSCTMDPKVRDQLADRGIDELYDSYRGGVGLARNGYDHIEDLFQHTWELLVDCGCSDGCPACIQSPHCGRANEPLDKRLAATLTMALADPSRQADDGTPKSD